VPDEEKEKLAKRQANAAVALFKMAQPEKVWPLLKHSPDPRARSYLIHRLSPLGAEPRAIVKRLEEEKEISIRRALLLCLGEFGEKELPQAQRDGLIPKLLDLYRHDPDPGIHGAVAWLLRQWGQRAKLNEIDEDLASRGRQPPENFRWYVNRQGQTFALIPGPVAFLMGSPRTEAGREGGAENRVEALHKKRIDRSFDIALHEVTVEQFLRFRKDHPYTRQYAPTPDCPVNAVTWYDAAAYCNWLSEQEGIPKDQWCYAPNAQGQYAEGMRVQPGYLRLQGYRLPTEAEWEYAGRAEAGTSRFYGEAEDLLGQYAWYTKNAQDRWMLPVGSLKPNDLGLFEVLGNALEWVQHPGYRYVPGEGGRAVEDPERVEDIKGIEDRHSRVWRGGAFTLLPRAVRSAHRAGFLPTYRYSHVGFRPARTYN
jgi:formylglycine-generating enzyme required for sulfatase activity